MCPPISRYAGLTRFFSGPRHPVTISRATRSASTTASVDACRNAPYRLRWFAQHSPFRAGRSHLGSLALIRVPASPPARLHHSIPEHAYHNILLYACSRVSTLHALELHRFSNTTPCQQDAGQSISASLLSHFIHLIHPDRLRPLPLRRTPAGRYERVRDSFCGPTNDVPESPTRSGDTHEPGRTGPLPSAGGGPTADGSDRACPSRRKCHGPSMSWHTMSSMSTSPSWLRSANGMVRSVCTHPSAPGKTPGPPRG